MSDVMLFGVLRMPLPDNPADVHPIEWVQIVARMRQAADEIERLRAENATRRNWVESLEAVSDGLHKQLAESRAQVAMLREALQFYGQHSAYRTSTVYMSGETVQTDIERDGGDRARAALEKTK